MSTEENKQRAVIGEYNLQLGDEVVVDLSLMDPESRHYYKGPPDGSAITICGFRQCDRYYGQRERCYLKGREPGLYRSYGPPIGQYSVTGPGEYGPQTVTQYVQLDCHAIRLTNREEDPAVRAKHEHLFSDGWRIGNLPELPFYPGDWIRAKSGAVTGAGHSVEEFVGKEPLYVEDFEWHWDNIPVRIRLNSGGSTSIDHELFDLVKRGNYWWWEHDRSKLEFEDIREEVAFYYTLGMLKQIRSPMSNNYRWGEKEAFRACLEGVGDVVKSSGSFFGSTPFPTVQKLDDSLVDLKRRLRETYESQREWAYAEPFLTENDLKMIEEDRRLYVELDVPNEPADDDRR